ncbi:MAG: efflux RND transporter periplasmic adaptor subunit [Anaerolineae bacterium]|nr:efflux RND transporter periplasmic adaptor subunit [Anaerolineae bacterium]
MKTTWQRYKKWIIAGAAVLVVALALLAAGPLLLARNGAGTTTTDVERVEVVVGDLSSEATASGELSARRSAALALMTSGTIDEVLVAVGDEARAGEPLLRLDTTELERNVADAQQALVSREADLEDLVAPPTAADLAAAEAAVTSAQASLDDLLDGPSDTELAAAEANLRAAQADLGAAAARLDTAQSGASDEALRAAQLRLESAQRAATSAAERHSTILVTEPNAFLSAEDLAEMEFSARVAAQQANADLAAAQKAYDDLVNGNPGSVSAARAAVAASAAQRDTAQAQLDALREGPTAAEVAAASASLAQAQRQLEQLQSGPSDAQRVAAEVAVESARISLARAERQLAEATLTAPFDGVVTVVNARAGETASGVLVEMADLSSLQLVLEVDEVDIAQVQVGQTAELTPATWSDATIPATVAAIAPEASGNSELVTYHVYLDVGESELPLRVGMTADARLLAEQLTGVLLLPNRAIQADRATGTYSVNRVTVAADGTETIDSVPVTIGLRDNRYTQITGGLAAGDVVQIGNALPVQTFGPAGGDEGDGPAFIPPAPGD